MSNPMYDGRLREDWLEELRPNDHWTRRHLLLAFALLGTPPTMLDIGCGTGINVMTARQLAIEAYGVDQLVEEDYVPWYNKGYFIHANLDEPFSMGRLQRPSVYDMVVCWEVAEHIPAPFDEVLCDTICSHVKQGGRLIFTAAHPGQGGTEHESERSSFFWRKRFHDRGLTYDIEGSMRLALLWSNISSPLYWLPSNLQIFRR